MKEIRENSKNRKVRYIPLGLRGKLYFILNYISNLIIIPNLFISIKNMVRDKEPVWLLHSFMPLLTLLIYTKIILFSKGGITYLRKNFL